MNEIQSFSFFDQDSPVELLGYAKNYIIEVSDREESLPEKYKILLSVAYDMLDEVQEYLYSA